MALSRDDDAEESPLFNRLLLPSTPRPLLLHLFLLHSSGPSGWIPRKKEGEKKSLYYYYYFEVSSPQKIFSCLLQKRAERVTNWVEQFKWLMDTHRWDFKLNFVLLWCYLSTIGWWACSCCSCGDVDGMWIPACLLTSALKFESRFMRLHWSLPHTLVSLSLSTVLHSMVTLCQRVYLCQPVVVVRVLPTEQQS